MDLFKDILPSIFEKTFYLFDGNHDESKYNPFIINKILSFSDSLAPLGTQLSNMKLTKKQHYDYLYYFLPRGKRYIKWFKSDKDENIQIVKEYYQCSETRAKEILNIISNDHVQKIKKEVGKNNDGLV